MVGNLLSMIMFLKSDHALYIAKKIFVIFLYLINYDLVEQLSKPSALCALVATNVVVFQTFPLGRF